MYLVTGTPSRQVARHRHHSPRADQRPGAIPRIRLPRTQLAPGLGETKLDYYNVCCQCLSFDSIRDGYKWAKPATDDGRHLESQMPTFRFASFGMF